MRFGFLEQFLIKILDLFVVFDLLLIRLVHFLEFHLLGGELPHRHLELPQFLRRAGLRVLFLLKLVLVEAAILFQLGKFLRQRLQLIMQTDILVCLLAQLVLLDFVLAAKLHELL